MAQNSSTLLTKYYTATTIITADVANMWYGGLYGTTEGALCDPGDPLVAGHVHDGAHQDGHAQQIHLVDHVTNQLRNANLADNAVIARNVQSFVDKGSAIPEFEIISGDTYYYLDLSDLRAEIANNGAFNTNANVTSNSPGNFAVDDFVFGSDSLDNDGNLSHDSRILFDKSKGALRAGIANSTQWDNLNRGSASTAFGRNNQAGGGRSTIAGGGENTIAGGATQAFIGGGSFNAVNGINSGISVGLNNVIGSSDRVFIGGGNSNSVGAISTNSFIGAGTNNVINSNSTTSIIVGGANNLVDAASLGVIIGGSNNAVGDGSTASDTSFVGAGNTNSVVGVEAAIVGGNGNSTTSNHTFIGGGELNSISGINSLNSIVVGGKENSVIGPYSVIVGGGGAGVGNSISSSSGTNGGELIVGGYSNSISSTGLLGGSMIAGGISNGITGAGDAIVITGGNSNTIDESSHSFIGGGDTNSVDNGAISVIVGGEGNTITGTLSGSDRNFIGGGYNNTIDSADSQANFSVISGGESNVIEASVAASGAISSSHAVISGGEGNVINDANYSVISGGLFNDIKAPIAGFSPHSFSAIRGGSYNQIDLAGTYADVGGLAGRGYLFNQFVHGGGYWPADVDINGFPEPRGQAQTSVIIASGTITTGDTLTTLFTDLTSGAGTLLVPTNSCVFCEATVIARDNSAPSLVAGLKYTATLKREFGSATVINFNTDINYASDGMPISFSLTPGALGVVYPEALIGTNSTFPVRVVAKVEWTQVYFNG